MSKLQLSSESFSTKSRLKKAGGSLVLTVPATARDLLGLSEGQEMVVSVKGQQFIAEAIPTEVKTIKVRKPKYTLDALLEGYDSSSPRSPEEEEWINAPAAGNETW